MEDFFNENYKDLNLHLNCCNNPSENDFIHFLTNKMHCDDEHTELLENYLIRYPKKVNIENSEKWTPLMVACNNKLSTPESIKLLLEKGADPNLKNRDNSSALNIFCNTLSKNFELDRAVRIIKLLLKYGADPNLKCDMGYTPLIRISCNVRKSNVESYIKISQLLIDEGADTNKSDCCGWTPLMFICDESRPKDYIIFLLKNGADPNLRDSKGHEICKNFFDKHLELLEYYKPRIPKEQILNELNKLRSLIENL